MLKRQYRLNSRTRINFTKSFTAPFFLLRVLENNLSYNRYGFVVSKKIDKRAVARNRTKRVFRSCIEENFKNIKTGHDMLFIVKEQIKEATREEICRSITSLLKKEGYL